MFSLFHKWIIGGLVWAGGTGVLLTNKAINYSSDEIILGTYEGYMSLSMAEYIKEKYGIRLDYFGHDQVVKDRFKEKIYGMAVVSNSVLEELIEHKLVEKVDWSKLELKKSSIEESLDTSDKVKELFTDVVQKISLSQAKNNGGSKLLDYGIPYFMNKLSFCYSGTEISDLKSSISWSKLMEQIAKEERFKPVNGVPKLAMIEDPRTLLSLSRFVGNETSVNSDGYTGTDSIFGDYQKILDKLNPSNMGQHFLYLDPNSPDLVDSLVSGDINGAFMYNADCLYASYGGNLGEDKTPPQLHVVEVDKDIFVLDFLVLSKNLTQGQRDKIYSFYKEVLMHGVSEGEESMLTEKTENDSWQDKYKQGLTDNFHYVRYTPVVDKLYKKVQSSYFENDSSKKDLRQKISKTEFSNGTQNKNITNHYESHLSSKDKSDMLVAFARFKEAL